MFEKVSPRLPTYYNHTNLQTQSHNAIPAWIITHDYRLAVLEELTCVIKTGSHHSPPFGLLFNVNETLEAKCSSVKVRNLIKLPKKTSF